MIATLAYQLTAEDRFDITLVTVILARSAGAALGSWIGRK